jgi:ferredoxin-NADP reductase
VTTVLSGSDTTRTGAPGAVTCRELELDCVVERRHSVAEDVVSLLLRPTDGGELPPWTPGAHIDLLLTPSLTRQYSLCGSPADSGSWRIGVLRDPHSRGGSRHVHDLLETGSRVRVRGPRNHFPLVGAPRYLFIAGGIGVTPMLPMIEWAVQAGADWRLLYGGRRRASMAFLDELAAHGDRVEVCPEDERGLLDLAAALDQPRDDTLVYCCGPEPLLAAVEAKCASWPAGSLHVERFAAKPQAEEPHPGTGTSFELALQRSGITVMVPPDRSILDICEEAGVSTLASCREGVCGTCEASVLEGVPDHRDSVLSDAERESSEFMMICVSRCRSPRLVLDL